MLDAAGHQMTDALLAAMIHQAFLLGALYELDRYGQITTRLFENLNTRLYRSSGAHKFVSLLYGEVSEEGRSGFLSAGQPLPRVFSPGLSPEQGKSTDPAYRTRRCSRYSTAARI